MQKIFVDTLDMNQFENGNYETILLRVELS